MCADRWGDRGGDGRWDDGSERAGRGGRRVPKGQTIREAWGDGRVPHREDTWDEEYPRGERSQWSRDGQGEWTWNEEYPRGEVPADRHASASVQWDCPWARRDLPRWSKSEAGWKPPYADHDKAWAKIWHEYGVWFADAAGRDPRGIVRANLEHKQEREREWCNQYMRHWHSNPVQHTRDGGARWTEGSTVHGQVPGRPVHGQEPGRKGPKRPDAVLALRNRFTMGPVNAEGRQAYAAQRKMHRKVLYATPQKGPKTPLAFQEKLDLEKVSWIGAVATRRQITTEVVSARLAFGRTLPARLMAQMVRDCPMLAVPPVSCEAMGALCLATASWAFEALTYAVGIVTGRNEDSSLDDMMMDLWKPLPLQGDHLHPRVLMPPVAWQVGTQSDELLACSLSCELNQLSGDWPEFMQENFDEAERDCFSGVPVVTLTYSGSMQEVLALQYALGPALDGNDPVRCDDWLNTFLVRTPSRKDAAKLKATVSEVRAAAQQVHEERKAVFQDLALARRLWLTDAQETDWTVVGKYLTGPSVTCLRNSKFRGVWFHAEGKATAVKFSLTVDGNWSTARSACVVTNVSPPGSVPADSESEEESHGSEPATSERHGSEPVALEEPKRRVRAKDPRCPRRELRDEGKCWGCDTMVSTQEKMCGSCRMPGRCVACADCKWPVRRLDSEMDWDEKGELEYVCRECTANRPPRERTPEGPPRELDVSAFFSESVDKAWELGREADVSGAFARGEVRQEGRRSKTRSVASGNLPAVKAKQVRGSGPAPAAPRPVRADRPTFDAVRPPAKLGAERQEDRESKRDRQYGEHPARFARREALDRQAKNPGPWPESPRAAMEAGVADEDSSQEEDEFGAAECSTSGEDPPQEDPVVDDRVSDIPADRAEAVLTGLFALHEIEPIQVVQLYKLLHAARSRRQLPQLKTLAEAMGSNSSPNKKVRGLANKLAWTISKAMKECGMFCEAIAAHVGALCDEQSPNQDRLSSAFMEALYTPMPGSTTDLEEVAPSERSEESVPFDGPGGDSLLPSEDGRVPPPQSRHPEEDDLRLNPGRAAKPEREEPRGRKRENEAARESDEPQLEGAPLGVAVKRETGPDSPLPQGKRQCLGPGCDVWLPVDIVPPLCEAHVQCLEDTAWRKANAATLLHVRKLAEWVPTQRGAWKERHGPVPAVAERGEVPAQAAERGSEPAQAEPLPTVDQALARTQVLQPATQEWDQRYLQPNAYYFKYSRTDLTPEQLATNVWSLKSEREFEVQMKLLDEAAQRTQYQFKGEWPKSELELHKAGSRDGNAAAFFGADYITPARPLGDLVPSRKALAKQRKREDEKLRKSRHAEAVARFGALLPREKVTAQGLVAFPNGEEMYTIYESYWPMRSDTLAMLTTEPLLYRGSWESMGHHQGDNWKDNHVRAKKWFPEMIECVVIPYGELKTRLSWETRSPICLWCTLRHAKAQGATAGHFCSKIHLATVKWHLQETDIALWFNVCIRMGRFITDENQHPGVVYDHTITRMCAQMPERFEGNLYPTCGADVRRQMGFCPLDADERWNWVKDTWSPWKQHPRGDAGLPLTHNS